MNYNDKTYNEKWKIKKQKGFYLNRNHRRVSNQGILLAIAIPSILGYVEKAQDAKFMAAARTVNVEATGYAEEFMLKNPNLQFPVKDKKPDEPDNGRESILGYLTNVYRMPDKSPGATVDPKNYDPDFKKTIQAITIPDGYKVKQIDLEFDHQTDKNHLGWAYDKTLTKHTITKVSIALKKDGKTYGMYIVTLLNKQMYIYDLDDPAGAAEATEALNNNAEEAPVLVN